MQITVTITGDKETRRKLQKLGQSLLMFDMAMRDIGEKLSDYYGNEAFLSQGGAFNSVWPRLQARTSRFKSSHYSGRPPEVRTGKMMAGFRYTAQTRSVRVYNRMPYFEYQNSGTSRLPARQMIGKNKVVEQMVKDIIQKDIDRKIQAA